MPPVTTYPIEGKTNNKPLIKTINGKGDTEYCIDVKPDIIRDGLIVEGNANDYIKEFESINCKSNYNK